MPIDDFDQLLAELYGYGVSPEALASMPGIPNSFVENKWNQDAGTYLPTEMPYTSPSTRLWHGETMLDQLGLTLPMLGEAYGMPTMDAMQPFNPELVEGVEGSPPPSTPILDSMMGSSDPLVQKIGEAVANGADLVTVNKLIREADESLIPDDDARGDYIALAKQAHDERTKIAAGGSSSSTSGSGGYRGNDLTPVQQSYAEAGLPMPYETYTADMLPADALPANYGKQVAKEGKKANRFLKSVERFINDTKKRQDEALTDGERSATTEVVKRALKGLGLFGGKDEDTVTTPGGMQASFTPTEQWTPQKTQFWLAGNDPDDYNTTFAGGSPEAHAQIAQNLSAYQQQKYDEDRRTLAATRLTEQGRTPSSDAMKARVALARYLGLPL